MLDRGHIETASRHCRLDRFLQLEMTVFRSQLEQLDHLPGAALFAVTFDKGLPDAIEAGGPQTSLPSLFQRLRSGQCARLAIQHIQVMLQLQDLLLTAVTPFVMSDTAAVVP